MKELAVNSLSPRSATVQSVLPRLGELSRGPLKTSGLVSVMQCDTYVTPDFATLGRAFAAVVCPVVIWQKPLAYGLAEILAAGDSEISDALNRLTPALPAERALAVNLTRSGRKLIVVQTEVRAGASLSTVEELYRRTFSAIEKSGVENALIPLLGVRVGGIDETAKIAVGSACRFSATCGMETVFASNDERIFRALWQGLDDVGREPPLHKQSV